MNFTDREKQLLLSNAPVLSRITLYDEDDEVLQVFNEDDYLLDWELEDYRYVPGQGFIGQFVERLLDGHLMNIPENISLEDNEIKVEIAVIDPLLAEQVYHSYGRFIITKIEQDDAGGTYKFESSDYTKKCNTVFNGNDISYPCTALELLDSACDQANIDLDVTGELAISYIVGSSGLEAGDYTFLINEEYYDFTLDNDLQQGALLMLKNDILILRTVDSDFNITRTSIEYTINETSSNTVLSDEPFVYYDFINNDFVIEDNQFEENQTCRDVIVAIAKLGYTWARINEDNKLCLDFTQKTTSGVDTYNIIDTDLYYEATKTGNILKPINKVIIGMKNVEGENIAIYDDYYTEETDSGIAIYDNPLTHTEALRRIAIHGAESLFGITYSPITVESIGHPWLKGDDIVKVTNLEEENLYFYPFDRKIKYTGVLTTDISSQAENEVSQKYENKNTVIDRLHHTEIDVDKANNQIKLLSQQIDGNTTNITQLQLDVNGINQQVEHIENDELTGLSSRLSSVEQSSQSITNTFQVTGGINVIRNSAFLLQDQVWEFTDNGSSPYHTELGKSYNSSLSGQTVSVAEIKLRNVKVKSKSENITNLKIDGTTYNFNFYHKQDVNMTTTIKMYSTEDNTVKAFDDIVITGQQPFKNYEVLFTPRTYVNYTLEIIVTSTASVGFAYIYDMMLNSGDKQSWQPASDEIYSTTLTMSRLGLKVYSVGDGTITILDSAGLCSYETSDGKTTGKMVSSRKVDGDKTRTITTQNVKLVTDITRDDEDKWVETIIRIGGSPYKVEYIESGGQ